MKRISRLWLIGLAVALTGTTGAAPAQDYPSKAVRIVVPFPPGGPTDVLARLIGQKLQESLGQPFVVENRAGATGTIGTALVAKAPPDGYTILMAATSSHIAAYLYKSMSYDPQKDLAPIINVTALPFYLVVHPAVPASNVQELIRYAKERPGQLNFGSPGPGSGGHLVMEMFRRAAGIDVLHVPFKGAAPAVTALIAGQTQLQMDTISTSQPHVAAGKLRGLAVSGAQRSPALPDTPTLKEAGIPDFDAISIWFGMFAPAGTPAEILNKLNAEIGKALATSEVGARIGAISGEVKPNSVAEFTRFATEDTQRWIKVIQDVGAKVE